MVTREFITLLHIIFVFLLIVSPIIDDYDLKRLALVLLIFIMVHYKVKYGKCGLINIEKFFLKDNFKNGIIYNLIKPVISYKDNFFYDNLQWLIIIYIGIIIYQLSYDSEGMFPYFNRINQIIYQKRLKF